MPGVTIGIGAVFGANSVVPGIYLNIPLQLALLRGRLALGNRSTIVLILETDTIG